MSEEDEPTVAAPAEDWDFGALKGVPDKRTTRGVKTWADANVAMQAVSPSAAQKLAGAYSNVMKRFMEETNSEFISSCFFAYSGSCFDTFLELLNTCKATDPYKSLKMAFQVWQWKTKDKATIKDRDMKAFAGIVKAAKKDDLIKAVGVMRERVAAWRKTAMDKEGKLKAAGNTSGRKPAALKTLLSNLKCVPSPIGDKLATITIPHEGGQVNLFCLAPGTDTAAHIASYLYMLAVVMTSVLIGNETHETEAGQHNIVGVGKYSSSVRKLPKWGTVLQAVTSKLATGETAEWFKESSGFSKLEPILTKCSIGWQTTDEKSVATVGYPYLPLSMSAWELPIDMQGFPELMVFVSAAKLAAEGTKAEVHCSRSQSVVATILAYSLQEPRLMGRSLRRQLRNT